MTEQDDKQTIKDMIGDLQNRDFTIKQLHAERTKLREEVESLEAALRFRQKEMQQTELINKGLTGAVLRLEGLVQDALSVMSRISQTRKAKDARRYATDWMNSIVEPEARLEDKIDDLVQRDEDLRLREQRVTERELKLRKKETR